MKWTRPHNNVVRFRPRQRMKGPATSRRFSWRKVRDVILIVFGLSIAFLGLQESDLLNLEGGNARAKDGDSLVLAGTEIRLHGIDAPELDQRCNSVTGTYACGRKAREALRNLLRGQTITCQARNKDRYGRTVATCRNKYVDINREMVRQGWAAAYVRHSFSYVLAQNDAKASNRGIWQGRFEMPEAYRIRHRRVARIPSARGESED